MCALLNVGFPVRADSVNRQLQEQNVPSCDVCHLQVRSLIWPYCDDMPHALYLSNCGIGLKTILLCLLVVHW